MTHSNFMKRMILIQFLTDACFDRKVKPDYRIYNVVNEQKNNLEPKRIFLRTHSSTTKS